MTDHKAQAESRLPNRGDAIYPNAVAVAQVHATLYRAEQQRLANLIAFLALPGRSPETESRAWSAIKEGLGL